MVRYVLICISVFPASQERSCMKTIVISGSHSHVGKTSLGQEIHSFLNNSVFIKIGTGTPKPNSDVPLYPVGTSFEEVRKDHEHADFLIIESNSILKEMAPDLLIFLPGNGEEKESATLPREQADITRGGKITCPQAKKLADSLGLTPKEFCRILDAARIKLHMCEFGVF